MTRGDLKTPYMAIIISLLLAAQMVLDVMQLELGLGPGLSVKNALLYAVALIIAVRIAMRRDVRFELAGVQVGYISLVLYAALTWAIVSTLVNYPTYPVVDNAMALKGGLVDYFLFFLVCFYGLRTEAETVRALKSVLLVVSFANLLTLLDSSGITHMGVTEVRDDGRVQGALGESNQYASFLCLAIPLLAAQAYSSQRYMRLIWTACTAVAALCMMVTVSRGGFLGLIVGFVAGCWLFRRQINVGRLITVTLITLAVLVVLLFVISKDFRILVMERIVRSEMKGDPGGVTSGRTDTWSFAIETMLGQPITLLTGFGWNAYFAMAFTGSPHNTYLNYWFNLGVPGVACLLVMYCTLIGKATSLARALRDPLRYTFMGFAVGTISLCVAIFFVELYQPWIYIWAIFGIVMRLAMLQRDTARQAPVAEEEIPAVAADRTRSNPYGWTARPPAVRRR